VFGVGRRTVGRCPGRAVAAVPTRRRRRPEVSPRTPPPPTVYRRPIRSLDDVAATKPRTTSRLTLCGAQLGISDRFPYSGSYFRRINSTSGLGPASQTKRWSTPAYEVQRFRHSAIVFAHFSGMSHFPSPKWRLKLLPVPVLT